MTLGMVYELKKNITGNEEPFATPGGVKELVERPQRRLGTPF
jgi:hypothetical protein